VFVSHVLQVLISYLYPHICTFASGEMFVNDPDASAARMLSRVAWPAPMPSTKVDFGPS
jgi:hypothetical protein